MTNAPTASTSYPAGTGGNRVLRLRLGLASLVVVGLACGNVSSSGKDATGVAGTTGTAGTMATAGTTGAAGTTGTAGSGSGGRGGTTGTAGSTGAAGSGSGGRGGTTGTAGSTGAAGSGSGGRGGTTGTAGTVGTAGSTGMAGSGSGGRGGGGGAICGGVACPMPGRLCCSDKCINPANDPFNCGGCGKVCEGGTPMCDNGTCQRTACAQDLICTANTTCCGNMCCPLGALCCNLQGPVSGGVSCHMPTTEQPTCPQGCAPFCISDRNLKKNITPADTAEILRKVRALPISHWTYTNEPADVRHLGPMAQDFYGSFGLGNDDRSYHSVDAHGVALAAIQALERRVAEQGKRMERLERENRRLTRQLESALADRERR